MTTAEAVATGLRFHPSEYAIPASQAETLLGIWRRYRGLRYPRAMAAGMLWLNTGPASYPDEEDRPSTERPFDD